MKRMCPNCKKERTFRSVSTSRIDRPPTRDIILGPGGKGQFREEEIELPLAYCVECKTVIYTGKKKS